MKEVQPVHHASNSDIQGIDQMQKVANFVQLPLMYQGSVTNKCKLNQKESTI